MEDGQERPVAMSSRTLHSAERRYSQLDKEATSISFGIQKFHNYLAGRSFTIVTDHKPLLGIFDPKKAMPTILSPRLTRIAITLTSHDYDIRYKPGTQIGSADSLSRWPQPVPERAEQELSEILLMAEKPDDFPFDAEHIAAETSKDKTLSQVTHYVQRGWPGKVKGADLHTYWLHRMELSLQDGCLLLGNRVVVPPPLRAATLRALHKAHSGIVQTKALARSYIWWPHLNEDIEALVGQCNKCLEHRHMPPRSQHEWITPTRRWSRLHIDFAGPFRNKYFLIIVDAYSRWPEVFVVNNTTSATVIKYLRIVFANHGLCEILVSDNGTAFVSEEMKRYLRANKIRQITTAPYHPATNGLAERMVQTVKDKIRKMDDMSWDIKIPNMLLSLRTTPCAGTNRSPAEVLMNRKLRTLLDVIHPDNIEREKTEQQIMRNNQQRNRESEVGNHVMYKNYSNGPKWLPGKILDKHGPSSYSVLTEDGQVVKRHIDQIIKVSSQGQRTQERGEICEDESGSINEDSEQIIEIPSEESWPDILGIPKS